MASELTAVRLTEELREALRDQAEREGVSVSEIIRRAVELYIASTSQGELATIRGERKRIIKDMLMEHIGPIVEQIVEKAEREGVKKGRR